ncbi:MAG: hypothetical protein ACOC6L_00240 [Thermodesulfobacteriota bacterium]
MEAKKLKKDKPSGAIAVIHFFALLNLLFGVGFGIYLLSTSIWGLALILEGILVWAFLFVYISIVEKFFDMCKEISSYISTKKVEKIGEDNKAK